MTKLPKADVELARAALILFTVAEASFAAAILASLLSRDWHWMEQVPVTFLYLSLSAGVGGILMSLMVVRYHLLELIFVMMTASTAVAVLLRAVEPGTPEPDHVIVAMLTIFPLVFIGAAWGLSVAQRLGIERTWPRLGLIVMGWLWLTGVTGFLSGLIAANDIGITAFLALELPCCPLLWLGLHFEQRARGKR